MNSYQKQYADALRMAIKRKTKKDADEWLDQQKVSDGKTRIAMKKAYIEGRLSNLTDESIVSLYEIMDSIYMSDRTEYRGEESTEEILEKLYDVQVKYLRQTERKKKYNDHFDHSQRIARLRKEHLGAEACRFEYGNRQLGRFA